MSGPQKKEETNASTNYSMRQVFAAVGILMSAICTIYIVKRFTNGNVSPSESPTQPSPQQLDVESNVESSAIISLKADKIGTNSNGSAETTCTNTDDNLAQVNVGDGICVVDGDEHEQNLQPSTASIDSNSDANYTENPVYLDAIWWKRLEFNNPEKFSDLKRYMIDHHVNIEKLFELEGSAIIKFINKADTSYMTINTGQGIKKYHNIKINLQSKQDTFNIEYNMKNEDEPIEILHVKEVQREHKDGVELVFWSNNVKKAYSQELFKYLRRRMVHYYNPKVQ